MINWWYMNDFERILMECRYLVSLKKDYTELAKIFHTNEENIYDDLNNKLKTMDNSLYIRVKNILKMYNI